MVTKDPKAEIYLNEDIVKALIESQFPDLSHLKITFLDAGWDNENYRLGSEYIIRIPRREVACRLILNEISWLPKLREKLPIDIPAPIGIGKPDQYYPWHWSIIPWYEGAAADRNPPAQTEAFKLIEFLKKLHIKNPENAPENLNRGVRLSTKNSDIKIRMQRLRSKTNLISCKIEDCWHEAINEPCSSGNYLIHGDLHPRNIIVDKGRIKAIIDWGDITGGDPATDLCSLWMLFRQDEVFFEALNLYGASEGLIKRSIGWAIFFGVILLDTGLSSNARHAKIGESILKNLTDNKTKDNNSL